MKTNHTIKTLLAALLLAAALSPAHAASLITAGDFDSLPVGTAPDVDKPAGHWFWPADYLAGGAGETTASEFSIVPAPTGGTGNALRLSSNTAADMYLPNFLARSVSQASGEIIIASFDIYVATGHGGGAVILSKGGH